MKEEIMKLIERNNEVVKAVERRGDVQINTQAMFAMMEINHAFACLAHEITHMAREAGIDAKVCMQSGEITVYGDIQ